MKKIVSSIMNWLVAPKNRMGATIAIVIFLALVTSQCAQAEIMSMTGVNGVQVSKALVIKDPRNQTISFCEPDDSGKYICAKWDVPNSVIWVDLCDLVTVPEQGPELVCGKDEKI